MLANKLISLSITLQQRPDLVAAVAAQLAEIADCVRAIEHSPVPTQMMAQPIGGNVVRIDRRVAR